MITSEQWSFIIVGGLLAYIFLGSGIALGWFFRLWQETKK